MADNSNEVMDRSWYTKYRPKTIDEYCGDRIKELVRNRFKNKADMPHVIMIYGTRGTGKTTLARILAKYYMCTNPHADGTPCEECENCQSINETLIDGEAGFESDEVREVNASMVTGKEDIDNILEEAIQPPVYSAYKMVIFDECHNLSKAAQNSLLKVIEDVPSHLCVLFCTTDPNLVIQTIHSRCQLKIEARRQTVTDMANRLMFIAQKENVPASIEALQLIAKKGDRVPRECINLLENIAKGYGEVTIETVKKGTDDIDTKVYQEFIEAANKNLESILLFNKSLKDRDISISDFLAGLSKYVLDCLNIKHGIGLDDYTPDYVKSIKTLFKTYTSQDFDMLIQVIQDANRSLSVTNLSANELTLIMLAMRISKIELLANGLATETAEAVEENKISMAEYSRLNKVNIEKVADSYNTEMDLRSISEGFREAEVVNDTAELMRKLATGEVIDSPESTKVVDHKEYENNTKLDSFFNN